MKLLELIVKNVKRENIHNDTTFVVQDGDGEIKISNSNEIPILDGSNIWVRFSGVVGYEVGTLNQADDWHTSVITIKELMRAYDLVEQGYTLWFGGECPVDDGVMVDVVFGNDGSENGASQLYRWGYAGVETDIIAYKISDDNPDEKPVVIESASPTSPILCDLMRDISTSMPEMMAADMVELADYLISQGWGKHE